MTDEITPSMRRALEMIAAGTPASFHCQGKDRTCSLCGAHIELAREALGWASIPQPAGEPRVVQPV